MGAMEHPVGVGAEIEQGGFGAEIAQEFAFGLGVGGGTRFRCGITSASQIVSARQADAYFGGLGPGAIGEKEVTEGDGVGDAERSLRIFVVLFDAIFESG